MSNPALLVQIFASAGIDLKNTLVDCSQARHSVGSVIVEMASLGINNAGDKKWQTILDSQ